MFWYHWAILAGAIALACFLIVHFFLRISNDYADIKHRYRLPSCESCSDSSCGCGLGDDHEQNTKPGRGRSLQGEATKETDQKTLNVEE